MKSVIDMLRGRRRARTAKEIGRQRTDEALGRLRTFGTAKACVGALTVTVNEGRHTAPSSLNVLDSNGTHIGWVALGHLFLRDERQRTAVLDGLAELQIPIVVPGKARPEAIGSPDWGSNDIPNAYVSWGAGGHDFAWVSPENAPKEPLFQRTFAFYNPTTMTLWVEDQRLVVPACIVAARVGLEIVKIGLPPQAWTLREHVRRGERYDYSYGGPPPYVARQLAPGIAEMVPGNLFSVGDVHRFAQIKLCGYDQTELKSAPEPTDLLERLTSYRLTLFPDHTYLDTLGRCRICERPAGRFQTQICTEILAYCHRCLAVANNGLPNDAGPNKRATARATVAVRALADQEFDGAAFVESQLSTVHGDSEHPVDAQDIDMRLLLRIAITRRQLAWTRILIDAGLADNGIRLSRGTVLKAIDGHLCSSMLEKSVDDFLHAKGIGHVREPLYPFDEQLNPNSRLRADWLLTDGTFVEMWGMPDEPAYAEKMRRKLDLAARHDVRLIGLMPADARSLDMVFVDWVKG